MFYTSLLRCTAADPFPSQRQDNSRPPIIMVDKEKKWEVEHILKRCTKGRQRQVLIKWKGYLTPTWEPTAALANTEAHDVFKAGGVMWQALARIILFPALAGIYIINLTGQAGAPCHGASCM